ncbi:hypothetical protein Syun_030379 [Stephania yunnanensis]|uniref:C3H1-type domain-containing protein n=1 Tax=Stephania yunnanensis TaxID=152371 RepID=A0AAP0E767_9MAGN
MNRKNEICRHFLRGSCKFGDRCNYLHPIQQRQKPNNSPFGIDHGNQHHPSDSASQPRNQFKPGENKWNRFNPLAGANSTPARQSDNQGQVADHKCTDPELCKRQVAEDFKNERPLWHLTCYAHLKYLPCDIVGDISYDELRLAAYVDAKQGLDFPSIVCLSVLMEQIAKERSLLNSKLAEFDNLLRNPYLRSSNSVSTSPSPFSVVKVNEFIVGDQNKVPSAVSSFSQLGFSTNEGPNKRQVLLGYMKVVFRHAFVPASNFGDPRPFPISSSVDLGMNNLTAGSQALGGFGKQLPSPNITKFNNISTGIGGSPFFANPASSFSTSHQHQEMANPTNGLVAATAGLLEEGTNASTMEHGLMSGVPSTRNVLISMCCLLNLQIPEDAPSDEVIALGAVTGS